MNVCAWLFSTYALGYQQRISIVSLVLIFFFSAPNEQMGFHTADQFAAFQSFSVCLGKGLWNEQIIQAE